MSFDWLQQDARPLDLDACEHALARQRELTKPRGALGRMEDAAVQLASLQRRAKPRVERVRIVVFAADHGVAAERVSLYPQSVTAEMVRNFSRGGAAISVLARELGAELEVVDVGTVLPPGALSGVRSRRIAAGTSNLAREPAMTEAQLMQALDEGCAAVDRAIEEGADIFIGGDMGIGNTTAASALACALIGVRAEAMVGPGTGLDAEGVAHKTTVVQTALDLHTLAPDRPLEALRCVGGFEIAALAGAYVRCAQRGLPVLVDGFIASAAALAALRLRPDAAPWFIYAHVSAEPGHGAIMEALGAQPLLNLGMRLGEGSGAAVAVPLLRMACALHNGMATFAEAGVSDA